MLKTFFQGPQDSLETPYIFLKENSRSFKSSVSRISILHPHLFSFFHITPPEQQGSGFLAGLGTAKENRGRALGKLGSHCHPKQKLSRQFN